MSPQYYVYVYRDSNRNPKYVGQGQYVGRSLQQFRKSHNLELERWLKKHGADASVEIIGPLGSKLLADRMETALISLLAGSPKQLFNRSGGPSEYRFRPFGVPKKFAARTEIQLKRLDFVNLWEEYGPILFVKISEKNFPGRGRGYDLVSIPTDDQIRDRIEKYWQLSVRGKGWIEAPERAPGILVSVFGGPGEQLIIGACRIEKKGWADALAGGKGGIVVPIKENASLDAGQLRGKRISRNFGLRFAPRRAEFFQIFSGSGKPN